MFTNFFKYYSSYCASKFDDPNLRKRDPVKLDHDLALIVMSLKKGEPSGLPEMVDRSRVHPTRERFFWLNLIEFIVRLSKFNTEDQALLLKEIRDYWTNQDKVVFKAIDNLAEHLKWSMNTKPRWIMRHSEYHLGEIRARVLEELGNASLMVPLVYTSGANSVGSRLASGNSGAPASGTSSTGSAGTNLGIAVYHSLFEPESRQHDVTVYRFDSGPDVVVRDFKRSRRDN